MKRILKRSENNKIVYFSDFLFDEYNSVRDILYEIVTHPDLAKWNHIVVKTNGCFLCDLIKTEVQYGYNCIYTFRSNVREILRNKDISVGMKVKCLRSRISLELAGIFHRERRYLDISNKNYVDAIIKRENPHLVVFFNYDPNEAYVSSCVQNKIPYISILYDTYLERPYIDKEAAFKLENTVITQSQGYFIPNFFYDAYAQFHSDKIKKYALPLLIDKKNVNDAYENSDLELKFTYFGQIQSFRNGDKIKDIFRELGEKLDVFSTKNYESDDVFNVHLAVTGEEMYRIVAQSRILVAIDNSEPYAHYLPSKVYLYASFTKPIIAFGDNRESAMITFFENYPWFYYQNINEPLDGLIDFINSNLPNKFDDSVYSQYLDYLPENALKPLIDHMEYVLK